MSINQPPGGSPGRLPVDFRPRRLILLPYNDLSIDQGLDQFLPIDPSGFSLTLGMVYGLGPNEPRVLRTDDAGNLLVAGSAVSTPFNLAVWDPNSATWRSWSTNTADNQTAFDAPNVKLYLGNGTGGWDHARDAGAPNMASLSGLGAALVASPGEWTVNANAGLGVASSASRGVGGVGVRHIITGYNVIISCQAAPGAGNVIINIRDGATGAGTIFEALQVGIPAAVFPPIVISRSGLSLVGTANTAFTIEQSAAYAAVQASINFEGFDAS
jgi:hypothetical protein